MIQATIVRRVQPSDTILPVISVRPPLQDKAHIAIAPHALMETSADKVKLPYLMDLTVEVIISSALVEISRELSAPTVWRLQMVPRAVLAQLANSAQPVSQPLIVSLVTNQLEVFPNVFSALPVKSQLVVQLRLMPLVEHGPLTVKRQSSLVPPAITVMQELLLGVKLEKLAPKVHLLLAQLPQVLSVMKSTSSMISLALPVKLVEPQRLELMSLLANTLFKVTMAQRLSIVTVATHVL